MDSAERQTECEIDCYEDDETMTKTTARCMGVPEGEYEGKWSGYTCMLTTPGTLQPERVKLTTDTGIAADWTSVRIRVSRWDVAEIEVVE